jgi:hypothetical protein
LNHRADDLLILEPLGRHHFLADPFHLLIRRTHELPPQREFGPPLFM